jgi:putative transposase
MPTLEVTTVIKLGLEPDIAAAETLDGQSRICNWLYNTLLDTAQNLRKHYIESKDPLLALTIYSKRGLRNLLPKLKEEHPFLKVVHSSPLKNAALRLSNAIQTHQKSKKGKRKGKITGWPKFRSWKSSWFSLLYDEPGKGYKIEENQLILSLGMGQDCKQRSLSILLKDAPALKRQKIRNLRIVKQQGRYFAIFSVHKEMREKHPIKQTIALDPNHKNLAYGADTEGNAIEIASPNWLKIYDKRIDELKSKRDRCLKKSHQKTNVDEKGNQVGKSYWESSRRWKKYNKALEKALHKRREQTKTFLYTTAHQLFSVYDCVAIGNYTPHGNGISTPMRRAMNNRSLIGRLKQILAWVATKSGKTFLEYDEKGTTRTCHHCHYIVEGGLSPNIRYWECVSCKTKHIRDENSAQNGLRQVLRDLATKSEPLSSQVSGSDLVSIVKRWAWRVLPSGIRCILRGQNSEIIANAR